MSLSPPNTPSSLGTRLQNRSCSPARSARTSCESGHSHLRPTTPTSVHSSSSELGDNDIIPPPCDPRAPRTLVLCFDGTGDQFDSDNSNVVKFFSLLKKDDRREQMVYYQAGIGTYTTPQVSTAVGRAFSELLDEMVAWNLDAHVMSGYEFLMQNYEAGDKICLFGFSRGAYTARALAGMLHKVGLLPPDNFQQIPFAYKMYTRTDELGWKQSTAFKKAFSIDVEIDFIGVWDTVCSVGVIPHRLPFTASNTAIRTFRHALSLDERRAKFKANYYNRPTDWESKQGTHRGDMPRPSHHHARRSAGRIAKAVKDRVRYASGATTSTMTAASASEPGATPEKPVKTATNSVVKEKPGKDEDERVEASVTAAATTTTTAGPPRAKNSWAAAFARLRATKRTKSGTTTTVAGAAAAVIAERHSEDDEKTTEITEGVAAAAATLTSTSTTAPPSTQSNLWASAFGTWRTMMRAKKGKRLTEEEQEFDKTARIQGETDVKEVWFAGCHCDVGGGSVPDDTHHALARIPLRWMIRECFRTNTGIRFHGELLKQIGLDPATLWPNPQPAHEWPEESFVYPGVSTVPTIPLPPPQSPMFTAHVVAPTPMEKTQEEIGHAEKEAAKANVSTLFPKTVPPVSAAPVQHNRDISTSTAHTLVNGIESQMLAGTSATSALVPPGWGPDPDIDELAEERKDARCQIYDQLSKRPFWWLLEFLPIEQRVQRADDHKWEKHYRFNLGRGREVPPNEKFLVHRSVKFRMEQKDIEGGPYHPRARWPSDVKPIYVD
ncbi:hypothetical protein OH77DRAFT_1521587 [Trametes cingulata]|nr:hypothetical protein OH77DRAFT_1521587 [Trametes cingulata]